MERPEAIRLGHNTYETGRECKNGHLTYRYTQSGTCAGCISDSQGRISDSQGRISARVQREARLNAGVDEERTKGELREARAQLIQVKLRAFVDDLEAIKAAAHAFAVMRCPALQMGHVYPALLPLDPAGGTAL